MPEFKVRVSWYKKVKHQIWNDKEPQEYHRFSVVNYHDLPPEYFSSQKEPCLIWIVDWVAKDIKFKQDTDYQFIIKLGEPNTAHFKHKVRINTDKVWSNNMILKNKEYFQNTVRKIGYWGNENYFYETNKKENSPPRPNQPTQNQPTKNIWFKITLICLIFLVPTLLLLCLIKWMSKRKK
ncbi:MAG: hypothetical protein I3273_00570 [Candidatus Moeniiplasma glomeromycotorum]|nr:hypothetical protein [Candidatus Moeniiplasma glomeromycotorum]MCE8167382.1 hypothetical protein [Candidatus Moeniiplasma glomeromycotorum]MCE8168605.1 hypothetical protein [Candidatus Moeniiplasma glomeromycotorum]